MGKIGKIGAIASLIWDVVQMILKFLEGLEDKKIEEASKEVAKLKQKASIKS